MGGCNVYTKHGRYGLSCMYIETMKSISSAVSVWYVGVLSYVVN